MDVLNKDVRTVHFYMAYLSPILIRIHQTNPDGGPTFWIETGSYNEADSYEVFFLYNLSLNCSIN